MDAAPALPPSPTATEPAAPYLPPSSARPAPRFEPRIVEIDLAVAARPRRTSLRAYLLGAAALAVTAVGGWFAFDAYIYG